MSELTKEKISNKAQQPAKPFTLFDQSNIEITLTLPSALQMNQDRGEIYPSQGEVVPTFHNKTAFPVKSAKFTITLPDVTDGSSNVIANVRWWKDATYEGLQTMEFTCGEVSAGGTSQCIASIPGYPQIRWHSTVSSGHGTEIFKNNVSFVSLIYGPFTPSLPTGTPGPVVQIG
ncbi:hypothetical protein NYP20_01560 [Pseudomonas sp. N3-W]|uniref:hypothetical protein n=1 Tax=Pseudomonas sp. N3-W TaxID=2975049 RepID=UPI00217F0F5F|nr:hypothetical protein [Pseudomonas sp. N3-W]UWF49678.1 hypothetical protein NYP20_01560 [Pseudomonas sp. N3-W]